jgi:excisionase family DNA binding protein
MLRSFLKGLTLMGDALKRSSTSGVEIELESKSCQLTLEDWVQMLEEDAASIEHERTAPKQASVRSSASANDTPGPRRRESDRLSPVAPPRESPATDSLLSPEDVARRCGLSRKAVYRAVARGELRAARIVSRLRIDPRDVEAWIRANVVDADDPPPPAPTRSRLPASIGLRRLLPES